MADGGYFADPSADVRPAPVRVLRTLLWADAALTAVMLAAGIGAAGVSAPVVGHLLVMAWPGVVAAVVARGLVRPRRAHAAWLLAAASWQILLAVSDLLGGDPRGATSLLLPSAIAALLLSRPVRTHVRAPARGDRGATALEYAGLITVAAVLLGTLVALGLPTRTGTAAHTALCSVLETRGCAPAARNGGKGPEGGAAPNGGDAPREGGAPPSRTAARCHGLLECAWRAVTTDPYDAAQAMPCDGVLSCLGHGALVVMSSQYNVDKAIVTDAKGILDLARDPGSLADAATYIRDHPGTAIRQLIWDDESIKLWNHGNYVGAVSRGIWNVGSWLLPGGQLTKTLSEPGKLGKLARLANKAGELSRLSRAAHNATKAAGRAERLARKGDAKGARAAANEARRRAAEATRQARKDGCAVALPELGTVPVPPRFGRFGAAAMPACSPGDGDEASKAEKAADRATSKAWDAALNDPYSMAGMDLEDVRKMIPSDWPREAAREGDGIRYVNPHRQGEQVIVERGWPLRPGRTPNVHHGPYLRISKNGKVRRVPLEGNPDPTHWDPP